MPPDAPFSAFLDSVPPSSPLREAITHHYLASEPDCVGRLLPQATLPPSVVEEARGLAARLIGALREKGGRGAVQALVREYDLSSQEGVALMCLAEALLRIPDSPTRDALIRDKVAGGDWRAHVGRGRSVFVNAATWGLVVTGKLTTTVDEAGLGAALTRLIARGGEPLIRRGVDFAMRMMGEQFVTGRTIEEALERSVRMEEKGFRYSYDMLGEAAMTAQDATRYYREYETAIHAIGRAAKGAGPYERPGISIKLSALHPRYSRSQRARVMAELAPRVTALALLARRYDIGLNIDAEEADRLELSLDILETLCLEEGLAGWGGVGFVVQAYQKRAPFVLDWVIDLARRTGRRLMVRLVKGAYWDSEIKRAQVDGVEGFPVFTRKVHTDLSYIACARKLLAARDAVFPQFATHNAYTAALVMRMAGQGFKPGDYEFQCLHGMGEPLYEEIVGADKLRRPCRIYAPVGSHETLLAYLVRRLLENGANSSFVNRLQDPAVSIAELTADPATVVAAADPVGAPHERIAKPSDLFRPGRENSRGVNSADEGVLARLADTFAGAVELSWSATPLGAEVGTPMRETLNPADLSDVVGHYVESTPEAVNVALIAAAQAQPGWASRSPEERAVVLDRASVFLEERTPVLLGLIMREAGKTLANAVAEIREAVDFLRYYAEQVRTGFSNDAHRPLGVVACVSPWNFPLAIFMGQVSAALAAGNVVIAKPAEETPLIAAQAVAILVEAGAPEDAVRLLPGSGDVGARIVADHRVNGVMFTGSTEVARLIQRTLADRVNPDGSPVTLIAETGGQNAMIVDSSSLPEQVVQDVLTSAFDSAGQRCSALRILCVQEDVADRVVEMLKGAMEELSVGRPDRFATDIGPVISVEARDGINAHIERMRAKGCEVFQVALPASCADGFFVPPTLIEIGRVGDLKREVFGPVLHIRRYVREELDAVLAAIRETGYGLTFGLHTRIDGTIRHVTARTDAGNIYVNRNTVGAVVGSQPFGGHGLSGTGPKAGGPLYLVRLLAQAPSDFTATEGDLLMPGPVGEENRYRTRGRGVALCVAATAEDLAAQIERCARTGNRALMADNALLPEGARDGVIVSANPESEPFDLVLFSGEDDDLRTLTQRVAMRDGSITPVFRCSAERLTPSAWLLQERTISTNTTAAGGNAQLMMIG
ncbi:bifunctional proline dehydrogenase/L-glutamate gamma-semialdehyde dehydrogenase PutA [Acetobacter sacchari]|uniref:Bifunctional protein PutA n=1 Tax=Acetobacter sacchari TaxID=2661687 RepID=A0ABS3LQT7_9PROT|nr:bifunctional proline dehydrogenase/L-glutamate gamma-semialdehyde dehydrogenase PutA [Acetobacter sacchari]MBO1358270.1 bifunctional proline dehydrogenase/L-glutamate gamma-semialdehyde dehydrogenase PutA [Acetobacter sacchari]